MKYGIIICLIVGSLLYTEADINSGCPSWGCLSSGSFSLSSSVSFTSAYFKWSTEILHVQSSLEVASLRGCVSDQVAVVCSIPSGYVYLQAFNGKQVWNYTSMNYPYLPVMDIFGNFIGMDSKQLMYVQSSGFEVQSVNVSVTSPKFSLMLANNSMLLLTSGHNNTAQVVTYNTDGILCGAIPLRGRVSNVNGTFVPSGQPIIVGYRAYVITRFVPDVSDSWKIMASSGVYRLYALDLLDHMDLRIKIAWYVDLKLKKMHRSMVPYSEKMHVNSEDVHNVVAYLQGIVYVNIPVSASSQGYAYAGALWGIKDHGNHASVLFNTTGTYGQIALYDIYSLTAAAKKLPDDEQVMWISNRQNLIVGYNSATGRITGHINITALANITVITSKLAITRQPLALSSSDNILVLGGTDRNGTAFLVALETDTSGKARLLWKTSLSDNSSSHDVTWQIVGQISNIALAVPYTKVSAIKWQLCVVAMVLESGNGYNKLHVKTVWGY